MNLDPAPDQTSSSVSNSTQAQAPVSGETNALQGLQIEVSNFLGNLAGELRQQQQDAMLHLQNQVAELKAATNLAPTPANPVPTPAKPQPDSKKKGTQNQLTATLPDPTPFSGQREDLLRWQAQIFNKLSFNYDHFPTEESKISYAFSRLEGAAAQQVLPYFSNADPSTRFETLAQLSQSLDHAFGDPNHRVTAQARLHSLRQRNREFATHLAEFQKLAADSGYDSEAKKSLLHRGLSIELLKGLNHVPGNEIDTYEKFVSRCLELDNNIRATNALLTPDRDRAARAFPIQPLPVRQSTTHNFETGPEPMDLSATGPRKTLSTNEREERFRNRLCL